ncbi:MAG: ribosome maturation factor RimM [Alphaproteobacteria bacterium]|nr:ribosome maturation factor RimM [Alphaproteobacteria bacterium]
MKNNDKILVGKIVAPQGIRGEVRVQTFTARPDDFRKLEIISDRFAASDFSFVRLLNPTSNVIIARIHGINDRNAAETLRNTELFISRDTLPAAANGEYYQADLIGFDVIRNGKKIGVVDGFQNFGAGDIIELDNGDMVSFIGADVDMERRQIQVQ